jgi:hypothetical protein
VHRPVGSVVHVSTRWGHRSVRSWMFKILILDVFGSIFCGMSKLITKSECKNNLCKTPKSAYLIGNWLCVRFLWSNIKQWPGQFIGFKANCSFSTSNLLPSGK